MSCGCVMNSMPAVKEMGLNGICRFGRIEEVHTIVVTKDEPVEAVETEEVEEVPREGGYPSHIHVRSLNTTL